ncbi:MAG: hypothetical protein N2C14_00380, partial [Planctomycetales bacterium]
LSEFNLSLGASFSFHVEAEDNDDVSGPNVGKSSPILLRVVSEDELRADLLRREKEQRQELERQLNKQIALLADGHELLRISRREPKLTSEQTRLLGKTRKRQQAVGLALASVAKRLEDVLIEAANNRLDESSGALRSRLRNKVIDPLRRLAEDASPSVVRDLDRTRRLLDDPTPRSQSLADAVAAQTEIDRDLTEILKSMIKVEDFQMVLTLLHQIQRMQRDVLDRTQQKKRDEIKSVLEQGSQGDPGSNSP